ncbi:DUF1272 domain-containing protein [Nocardioides psychrotolerans]|uniref:DUF1272 domain-containing protein n=1 Tax=Nocardioides psychrotolerans TaxID=1005945 RepID=UPI0031376F4A
MRPTCERCDSALPPTTTDAFICSFECTWCRGCAEGDLAMACPTCSGELLQRPRRLG